MGWFDNKDLDEFKNYVEGRFHAIDANVVGLGETIEQLSQKISEKTPELVDEVRNLRDESVALLERTQRAADEAEAISKLLEKGQTEAAEVSAELNSELNATLTLSEQLKADVKECQTLRSDVAASKATTDKNVGEIATLLQKAKDIVQQADDVTEKIEDAEKLQAQCEGFRDNIQALVNLAVERKNEVDKAYVEIFGQDVVTDTKSERIEGLRDKLRRSFEKAEHDLAHLIKRAGSDVTGVTEQLKALMPGGMAAGLSAAYQEKAAEESESLRKLEGNFLYAIAGLALVSLIPFGVDVWLLIDGKDLIEVLRMTPVVPILPLYFPILWFAYSTNKKVNLSKRLIEEYTHKAVLGKTFSGLSNQIDSLNQDKDKDIAHELRTRLLYNMLQVSAENPGKLISNYNTADHPVMEALENSSKLSDSIDALQRIPGFKQLTRWLTDRKQSVVSEVESKVDIGLDAAEALGKSRG